MSISVWILKSSIFLFPQLVSLAPIFVHLSFVLTVMQLHFQEKMWLSCFHLFKVDKCSECSYVALICIGMPLSCKVQILKIQLAKRFDSFTERFAILNSNCFLFSSKWLGCYLCNSLRSYLWNKQYMKAFLSYTLYVVWSVEQTWVPEL